MPAGACPSDRMTNSLRLRVRVGKLITVGSPTLHAHGLTFSLVVHGTHRSNNTCMQHWAADINLL